MLTSEKRRKVLQRDGYTCRFCGHRGNAATLQIDHSRPVARGGTEHENNLRAACWVCNLLKRVRRTCSFEAWLKATFGARSHYARYTAVSRAKGRLPDLRKWLADNRPGLAEWLFEDWSLPQAHQVRRSWL